MITLLQRLLLLKEMQNKPIFVQIHYIFVLGEAFHSMELNLLQCYAGKTKDDTISKALNLIWPFNYPKNNTVYL